MGFEVVQGGILTTVQDEGRYGYQEYGVTPSGPMDLRSFHLANVLAGNRKEEAALEVTFVGPTLRFDEANVIAVTGGDLSPSLNGEPMAMYAATAVRPGDVLSFGGIRNGARSYIAFSGGLSVPEVMGSYSTIMKIRKGGFEGRKLDKGDHLSFRSPAEKLPDMETRSLRREHFPEGEVALRVVTGPQEDAFTEKGLKDFFWYSGTVTNEFDRMGCRIERDPIELVGDGNIITDGISFGSIQVPPSGEPIIMLADRQGTGGYPKIGTVISVDLPLVAQSRPGFKVRFIRVSLKLAQDLYIREYEAVAALEEKWKRK